MSMLELSTFGIGYKNVLVTCAHIIYIMESEALALNINTAELCTICIMHIDCMIMHYFPPASAICKLL